MDDREVDELHRIWELKEKGAISDEEYSRLKNRILGQSNQADGAATSNHAVSADEPGTKAQPQFPEGSVGPSYRKIAGIGCVVILALFFIVALISPTAKQTGSNALTNSDTNLVDANVSAVDSNATSIATQDAVTDSSPWSYSQDEDKVRSGTTYYARTTSTNSISQSFPYDSDTTMTMTVRKSPAYGTDVVLTISSGQMMCPSYEGCNGTVRFDNGPAQRVSFSGPADNSSDTIFVDGAKGFIAKLKSAKKVTIEKTLYEAGNPQFEFDVHGLKWGH